MSSQDDRVMDASGKYVRYTNEQVEALERVYHECPKPSSIRRQQLIKDCPILANIEPKQIKVWFQNRRLVVRPICFMVICTLFQLMIVAKNFPFGAHLISFHDVNVTLTSKGYISLSYDEFNVVGFVTLTLFLIL